MVRRVLFGGETQGDVAAAFATTAKTVGKWIERYQVEGLARRTGSPGRGGCAARRRLR